VEFEKWRFRGENVRSNVRELEGALRKILPIRVSTRKRSSIQLARDAERPVVDSNRQIGVENIQKAVADYKIKVADMCLQLAPTHCPAVVIAMFLAKELTQKRALEIGCLAGAINNHGVARGAQDWRRAPAES
jgi:chromosomal replication initiator protein